MAKEFVNVMFSGGELTVDKWIVEVDKNDVVVWVCENAPFAIHFDGESPFRWITASSEPSSSHGIEMKVVWEPRQFGGKKFRYYLAAGDGDSTKIIDPEIIVPPGGRGRDGQ